MRVMKFGGTSVRDFDRISAAADLVRSALAEDRVAVVVSALGGATDALQDAADASLDGQEDFTARCDALFRRHEEVVQHIDDPGDRELLRKALADGFGELKMLLAGVALVRECTPRTLDKVLSVGERLSSQLMAAVLRQKGVDAEACDARDLIVTDRRFGNANVSFEESSRRIRDRFDATDRVQVVTGFLAATPAGETTTLGRGGSDYTASLLGAALAADRIEIWTDVDGVQSADPRRVPDAFSLAQLSYDELLELSHFGAKVVYPPTVHPARAAAIPLLIKNTLNPSFPGTRVVEETDASVHPVRGISSISAVALLRLEGDGMAGIPGTAGRLFHVLAEAGIQVILISQASSEHSICLAVDPKRVEEARERVHHEFARERATGLIDDLVIDRDLSILAVVGADMSHQPGISGKLFGALGKAGINVHAIAQGSSELNISFAVGAHDETRALRIVHDAFFDPTRGHLFLLGVGTVGGELLEQLRATPTLAGWSLSGIANSTRMSLDRRRMNPADWSRDLLAAGEPADLDRLASYVLETPGRRVLLDCTASDSLGKLYTRLLAAGVNVATANKKPLAGSAAEWQRLRDATVGAGGLYFEATVGAGLPIVRTLQDQLATGDRLLAVEGLFSGTLGFLAWRLRGGARFSEALREAASLGFTEPDPREDLSGRDVVRKLLILARLGGARVEAETCVVEPLIPPGIWWERSLDDFWANVEELDEPLAARVADAASEGCVLTYLARWSEDGCRVGVDAVSPEHPAATVVRSENLFVLTTERYRESPMVIRGPGAGPAVTAAGVLSDLLRACYEGPSG